VHLVSAGKAGSDERAAADALYADLLAAGVEVLYDDRDMGPGQKFADAELLGCPLRLTLGRRSLESGTIEAQGRRGRVDLEGVPIGDGAVATVQALLADLP
jgi:prolyl-tRNA synthetase